MARDHESVGYTGTPAGGPHITAGGTGVVEWPVNVSGVGNRYINRRIVVEPGNPPAGLSILVDADTPATYYTETSAGIRPATAAELARVGLD